MKDVMLDFETLGTGKNACLCQVGAIYFDNVTGELGDSFKANIDAQSHAALGATLEAPTVYWWLGQSEQARKSITEVPLRDVKEVLFELNEFLRPAKRIWSHATFDFVILMENLKQVKCKPAFSYKAGLDIRTLVYLSGISFDKTAREGTHHDALDDCKHQVKYCVAALNAIKTSKSIIRFANSQAENE